MYRLVLVGAGQIGSRHLQGLGRLAVGPYELDVVEPDAMSVERAGQRLTEATGGAVEGAPRVRFVPACEDLRGSYDVGIVATSSAVRRACVERLLGSVAVR